MDSPNAYDDVMFNQLDHDNRLMFTVEMYGKEDYVDEFVVNVEPKLLKFYAVRSQNALMPENELSRGRQP